MDIRQTYTTVVVPEMKKLFGYTNNHAVPRLSKVVVNIGLGKNAKDDKFKDNIEKTLADITGQKPIVTKARHSIAGFGIREGLIIGEKVTLRGKKMYDFFNKVIHIALPRVRDFQGINPDSLDREGNLTVGFKEWNVFPEINSEHMSALHGLEVTFVTTAKNKQEALSLFRLLAFPFKK